MSQPYGQDDYGYYGDEQKRRRVWLTLGYIGVFVAGILVGALFFGKGGGAPKKKEAPTAATALTALAKAPTPAPTAAVPATPLTAATVAEEPTPPPEKDVVAFTPPKREPVIRPAEPPKTPSKKTAPTTGGKPLNPTQIKGTIDKRLGGIQAEYNSLLKTNPRMGGGKVSVRFTIAPNGAVTSAEVVEDTIGNSQLDAGILRRVKSWQFPRATAETKVVYPFVFVSTGV